jgi:hypothetical protein
MKTKEISLSYLRLLSRTVPDPNKAYARSKTPNGIAEVLLTPLAVQAFQSQFAISGDGPSDLNPSGHHMNLRKAWKRRHDCVQNLEGCEATPDSNISG